MFMIAAAVVAMATSVAAQEPCAPSSGIESQCHGQLLSERRVCCEGLACMQKDVFYGQCRKVGDVVPEGWMGTIIDYSDLQITAETIVTGAPTGSDIEAVEVVEPGTGAGLPAADGAGGIPVATGTDESMFKTFIGRDYIPSSEMTTNMVGIEDILGAAKVVANQKQCEEFCAETEGCNAASYYLDGSDFGGLTCFLKIIDDACELPADALDDPNATLLLMTDETCADAMSSTPAAGTPAAGDFEFGELDIDTELEVEDEDNLEGKDLEDENIPFSTPRNPVAGDTSPTTNAVSPNAAGNSAAGVSGAVLAVAAAVAAAALF